MLGGLGSAALIPVAEATGNDLFTALAFTGFFLNLFNMLPVVPLDGGRAMAALSPAMWFVGFAVLIGLTIAFPNPILILIVLFGALETWQALEGAQVARGAASTTGSRRATGCSSRGAYIAIVALLAFGMTETHIERDFGDV